MGTILAALQTWWAGKNNQQKMVIALTIFSLLATGALILLNTSSSTPQAPLNSTPLYFLSAFAKLIFVLLLIVGMAVFFKRWVNLPSGHKPSQQMRLLETVRLSPKQALHVVQAGGRYWMVGATDQSINLLASFDLLPDTALQTESQPKPETSFAAMLQTMQSSTDIEKKAQP